MTSQTQQLPPDTEGMNDDRAVWAAVALSAFMEQTGCDEDTAVYDLICDLHHWCDRNGQDFNHELERAQISYEEETLPPLNEDGSRG